MRLISGEIVVFLKEKGKGRDVGKFLNDVENDAQDSGIDLKTIRINESGILIKKIRSVAPQKFPVIQTINCKKIEQVPGF